MPAGAATPSLSSEATGPRSPVCPEPFDGELTVAAAASLTEAFVEIGEGFEAACGGTVAFTFDSSGRLAQQVADGAPIDVFASADAISLERVEDEDLVEGTSAVFARNRLVAITRPGNPQGIEALADLADADLGVIALCAEQAACGRLAAQAVERAGVVLDEGSVTRGQNATATATAVARGDAVAGLVFSTDARGRRRGGGRRAPGGRGRHRGLPHRRAPDRQGPGGGRGLLRVRPLRPRTRDLGRARVLGPVVRSP